jgi:hypothetical protein
MLKKITILVAALSIASVAAAQDKKTATVADFAGTWNVELMSHQVALVIEPAEGNKVTATMMMMGNDMPLKGELVDGTLTLTGVKTEGSTGAATPGGPHGAAAAGPKAPAKPIIVRIQEDGTLAGELMTNQGPAKFTGEKLKKKKS